MKKITLSIALASYMFGLTIDEAVTIGLNHSFEVKSVDKELTSNKYEKEALKSNFYPTFGLKYNFSKSNEESFIKSEDDSSFGANLNYNLFNGYIDTNKIKSADSNLKAKEFEKKALMSDIKLSIKEAYIDLLNKIENKAIFEDAVILLQNQAKDAKNFFEAGTIPKNEYLEVQVELASANQNLLKAKSEITLTKAKLERFLGQKVNDDVATLSFSEEANLNENELYKTLLSNRSEIKYFEALKEAKEYSTKAINGEYYPTVDLNLNYERVGDEIIPKGKKLFPTDELKAGVNLNWLLFDGSARSNKIEASKYLTKSIDDKIENLKEELLLQLRDAIEAINLSYAQYKVAKEALNQAKENYKIVEDRYKHSIATTTTLIDARYYLTRAKSEYTQSIYDLHSANAKLERVLE